MKKITITLYRFEELPETTQKQVTQKLGNINVDYSFWYEYSYDHFTKLCALLGITVESKSLHFKGFYSQGDGSSFRADVDLVKLMEAVKSRAWTELMPEHELDINAPEVSNRLISLIKEGVIDVSANVNAHRSSTGIAACLDWNYNSSRNFSNIERAFSCLENWFEKTAETLNNYLYKSLQTEYEFVTSEQSVAETIIANEYLFTADGELAFHLEALAEDP